VKVEPHQPSVKSSSEPAAADDVSSEMAALKDHNKAVEEELRKKINEVCDSIDLLRIKVDEKASKPSSSTETVKATDNFIELTADLASFKA